MVRGPAHCLYCRKRVGLLRRIWDRHFCCADHREKLQSRSARAMREAEELYGFDETQTLTWRAVTQNNDDKEERRPGYGATVFVSLSIVFVLLAISQVPSGGSGPKRVSAPDGPSSKHGWGQFVGNLLPSNGSSTVREDFHSG